MTSHDVVDVARRLVGTRRVGHAGTLDPLATGVLVVLVGKATRLARYLSVSDKTYHAVIRLGITMTTYDAEGDVVARYPVDVDAAAIDAALAVFRGEIQQRPPMVSAVKVGGQPLYKLARQGKEVERPLRTVTVHALERRSWDPPDLTIEMTCSAGTYVRSLAHDLGQMLGCGAHVAALTRARSGSFEIAESLSLECLRALAREGRLQTALLPPQMALRFPGVMLAPEQVRAVCQGQRIVLTDAPDSPELQALAPDGTLIAVLIPTTDGAWRPSLVLRDS
ncbi:MAG: tRNA pseudouridine(55) synthase TruB [Anaerolineae bacterium]|nr:tRNA pseudouridine(55) synthase TruB [Anaerolineae bacterium]